MAEIKLNVVTLIKSQRLAEQNKNMIKNYDQSICCLQEDHFRSKQLVLMKGWLKVWHKNCNQKRAWLAILNYYNGQRKTLYIDKRINLSKRQNFINLNIPNLDSCNI